MNFYAIEDVRKAAHKKIILMVATASAEHTVQVLNVSKTPATDAG